ncbi:uncharacterized protein LOC115709252 isoform X2 [Cannabis sativa]|uniref:uncharacterized protein LOC115709252 isoform X2 n=1 Tax=Cannabis sativa TaxID=3483 RepID=UPI0029CA64DF|nr:uncharacterized protein LOC115709252 isoform X2 [Cannabis sativa]
MAKEGGFFIMQLQIHSVFIPKLKPKFLFNLKHKKIESFCSTSTLILNSYKPNKPQLVWPSPTDEIPFWNKEFPCSDHMGVDEYDADADADADVVSNHDHHQLMHITHVTAEMAPIAKVGGLGDVVTGLARASLSCGHTVDIMLPFYECIPRHQITDLALITTFNSYHDGVWIPTEAYKGLVSSIPVIFIQPSNHFFKGKHVYGGSYNELDAYVFFSRACLEWMQVTGTQPDIIHVHEWQTSVLPLLYWDMYHNLSLKKPRIVLSIHNMEHFGECSEQQLSKSGLDGSLYATIDKAVDERTIGHNPERLSLLKGGIVYSNAVVTVSPTYLKETMCSGWLSSTLVSNRHKYFGILNGIDTAIWNPALDIFLPAKFHAENLEGKKLCKYFVQRGLGLASSDSALDMQTKVPLVVCITRLVAQKGLHLIIHAMKRVEQLGGQMIILGKAPDGNIQREFEGLANLHNEGPSIRILLMYSEELSHMLYAAADMVFVPSMYEPCGLAQMIGMRYGAVPVVRKTGGLADTVFDMDDPQNQEKANGFVFEGIDETSLDGALDRAFSYFKDNPNKWNNIVKKIMEIDNSWNNTAGKYIELYSSIKANVN